ncbi:hypothetical protein ACFJGX_23990 [Hydrogenophaga sp. UC242_50]|uniref:hypothetical protein n=2 Tax=unclassified Hydrogenophaga TaxID=2610897 RepID=UPI0036D30EE8
MTSPSFQRVQPIRPDLTAVNLAQRFDRMCEQHWLPEDWPRLKREAGLLLLGEQPDLELLQQLQRHYQKEPLSFRGDFRSGEELIRHLNRALDGLENLHGPHDPGRLGSRVDEVLAMLGEGPQHGPIFRDAVAIAFANFLGYIAGTAVQTAMEHAFCDGGGDLTYEKRVAAELVNRTVQHGVRFALRDVAIPVAKQRLGLRTLKAPGRVHLWILMVTLVVCSFDQMGLLLSSQLPPVRRSGQRQLPDVWGNSLQTGLFAVTDLLASLTIGYLTQVAFKSWHQHDPQPFVGLHTKGITHGVQAVGEGLLLAAWKHHMHQGLSPNNLCQRGSDSVGFHDFVALFDGIEIGIFWLMTFILGCMDRQEEAPLTGFIEHSVSNLSLPQRLQRHHGNGSPVPIEREGSSSGISSVPRLPVEPVELHRGGAQQPEHNAADNGAETQAVGNDNQHEALDDFDVGAEEHGGIGNDGGGVMVNRITPPNLQPLNTFKVGQRQRPFV